MTSVPQLPSEIIEMIFHFVPSTEGNWFNILTACKLYYEIARRVFDPSRESNKVKFKRSEKNLTSPKAIRWACRAGKIEVVNHLLSDPRVDPTACDNYCLQWAAAVTS
jgi:uncharacterized protein involved in cysteine biosynthesis